MNYPTSKPALNMKRTPTIQYISLYPLFPYLITMKHVTTLSAL